MKKHVAEIKEILATTHKYDVQGEPAYARWLCPEYPSATLNEAKAIRRGISPHTLLACGPHYSKKEAHLALLSGCTPFSWLRTQLGSPPIHQLAVLRWYQAVLQRPKEHAALHKKRTFRGPAGLTVDAAFIDRIDEIREQDLIHGTRTGVVTAFEIAVNRTTNMLTDKFFHDHTPLTAPPPWPLPKAGSKAAPLAQWLLTPAALCKEGRELNHCAATYVPLVKERKTYVLSIAIPHKDGTVSRSTAELVPSARDTFVLFQHKGKDNADAPPACKKWIARWMRKITEKETAAAMRLAP